MLKKNWTLALIALLIITIGLVIFFLAQPKKPKPQKTVSPLFVYQDPDQKTPSFSLKLPDGWYRDLDVKGNEKLLSFSPDKVKQGINYRAFITAGIAPTALDLTAEVIRARKEIGSFAVDHKFITDKSITVKGYPAHLLEYNTLLENDNQNIKQILGQAGLLTHHVDIITVKNGFFIDIAAYTNDWAWPEYVDVIQKSLNSISFNPI